MGGVQKGQKRGGMAGRGGKKGEKTELTLGKVGAHRAECKTVTRREVVCGGGNGCRVASHFHINSPLGGGKVTEYRIWEGDNDTNEESLLSGGGHT